MVSRLTQKTTIYLEPHTKKFLQLRSLQTSKSLSEIINEHFEFELKKFEDYGKTAAGKKHPSVAEWGMVKRGLPKNTKP